MDAGTVVSVGDTAGLRPGAPAERWSLLWANGYRPYTHPRTGLLAAMVLPDQILRIRPITSATEAGGGS